MAEKDFVLKGGTAINLFVRDMPRFSIDVDLCYLPIQQRAESLDCINTAFNRVHEAVKRAFPDIKGLVKKVQQTQTIYQIVYQRDDATVKVEINHVLRGCVYPPDTRSLCLSAQQQFSFFTSVVCSSFEDLYAGKICAALDRQHPRDLFDVKLLLENEGVSDKLRQTFLVYLISNNRPIVELLAPNLIDIRTLYERELEGMTNIPVTYEELIQIRKDLIALINQSLTDDEKEFLLSIKLCEPQWKLLNLEGIEKLPAVQWKLNNIKNIEPKKFNKAVSELKSVLQI